MDFIGWLGFICVATIILCGIAGYVLFMLDKDFERLFNCIVIVILIAYALVMYIGFVYGGEKIFDFLYYFFPSV